jgi:hypothetical protein
MSYSQFAKIAFSTKVNNKLKIIEDLLADWIRFSLIEYMADMICVSLSAKNYINEL